MTLPQRIAVNILESIGTHLWGFKPNMMRHFVLEYGALKSVMWFVKHMPKSPTAPQNQNDEYLLHLMSMFSVLNTCGIKRQVVPDEAHDPINKDKPLRERYAAARAESVC